MGPLALPEITEAEKLFKDAAYDTMIDLGIGALFAAYPFLNVFLVRDLVKWLLHEFANRLWDGFTTIVNLNYVVLKNESLQKTFVDRILELKGIATWKGIDSPEYQAARKVSHEAFAAHVRSLLVPSRV